MISRGEGSQVHVINFHSVSVFLSLIYYFLYLVFLYGRAPGSPSDLPLYLFLIFIESWVQAKEKCPAGIPNPLSIVASGFGRSRRTSARLCHGNRNRHDVEIVFCEENKQHTLKIPGAQNSWCVFVLLLI